MKTGEMILVFKTLVRHNNQMHYENLSWILVQKNKKQKHLKPSTSGTISKTEYGMIIRWYLGIINSLKFDTDYHYVLSVLIARIHIL